MFTAILIAPIALAGIPDGNDLPQHLRFASAYYEAILRGDFFPGWSSADNLGFGSIGIRYYPPVAYYLMAFTQILTRNWYETFWINSFFWMFLGCAGVYFWAKQWLSARQAVFTALLYSIAPYHSAQIYQFLFYAEFAASGILPFCFLFATRIIKNGKFLDVVLFSIAYSLLLLTHIPMTIIASAGLAVYALLSIDWKEPRKAIVNFLFAFVLSLSATAFHWLKVFSELSWVKHNTSQYYANDYYDFRKYFFPLIYSAGDAYESKLLWHLDVTIIFSILLFLPLIVYLILRFKSNREENGFNRKILYSLVITGLFSIFILSFPSSFIWNYLSVLQKTQFPWRWLSLTSLTGVLAFGLGIALLNARYQNLRKLFTYAMLMLLTSILLFDISENIIPAAFMPREKFEAKFAKINTETECRCWWTIWAEPNALEQKEKVYAGMRTVNITRWESEVREFTVEEGNSGNIRIASFYHPHWKAEVNGGQVEVQKADDGSILIPVSGARTSINLYFQEPYKLRIALFVSLITWMFLFGALLITYRNQKRFQTNLMTID